MENVSLKREKEHLELQIESTSKAQKDQQALFAETLQRSAKQIQTLVDNYSRTSQEK